MGKLLIITGMALIIVGVIVTFGGRIPWFGKLPGDICIQKKGMIFYVPITTSILISVILSIILMLARRR